MKKILSILAFMLMAYMANAQIAPSCPDENHPHAIDLGLPSGTKWACFNIGASHPEESGDFYAWGETTNKSRSRITPICSTSVRKVHYWMNTTATTAT